jgi:hypothetical protein
LLEDQRRPPIETYRSTEERARVLKMRKQGLSTGQISKLLGTRSTAAVRLMISLHNEMFRTSEIPDKKPAADVFENSQIMTLHEAERDEHAIQAVFPHLSPKGIAQYIKTVLVAQRLARTHQIYAMHKAGEQMSAIQAKSPGLSETSIRRRIQRMKLNEKLNEKAEV